MSDTATLISALRILARDIQSEDGVANACIAEAADRIEQLNALATEQLGINPWCTETGQNACSCSDGDGSYVCDFCQAIGMKGHMQ